MKKIAILTSLTTLFISTSALAQLTVDFGSIGSDITNGISVISDNVTETVKPIAEEYESMKKGIKGTIESAEVVKKAKEQVENAQKKIAEAKEKYNKYKGTVDQAKSMADNAKKDAEEAQKKAQEAQKKAEQMKEQAEAQAAYVTAKTELDKLKEEKQKFIDDEKAKFTANIKALEQNNVVYKQKIDENISDIADEQTKSYEEMLKKNEEAIAYLQKEMNEIENSETVKELDESIAQKEEAVAEKQKEMEAKAKEKAAVIGAMDGGVAISMIGGLFSGDNKAAYDNVYKESFIAEGEAPGGEAVSRIMRKRKVEAMNDVIDAYIVAFEMKQQWLEKNKMKDDLSKEMAKSDDSKTAITTETSGIRVRAMKNILDFLKLQAAEMKMLTAVDRLDVDYVGKSKAAFNFDDYLFTEEDAKGTKNKSLIDQAKDAKKNIEDAVDSGKKTAESAKKTVDDAKQTVEETKKEAEALANDVKELENDFDFGNGQ